MTNDLASILNRTLSSNDFDRDFLYIKHTPYDSEDIVVDVDYFIRGSNEEVKLVSGKLNSSKRSLSRLITPSNMDERLWNRVIVLSGAEYQNLTGSIFNPTKDKEIFNEPKEVKENPLWLAAAGQDKKLLGDFVDRSFEMMKIYGMEFNMGIKYPFKLREYDKPVLAYATITGLQNANPLCLTSETIHPNITKEAHELHNRRIREMESGY